MVHPDIDKHLYGENCGKLMQCTFFTSYQFRKMKKTVSQVMVKIIVKTSRDPKLDIYCISDTHSILFKFYLTL